MKIRNTTLTTPMDDAVDALFSVCKYWPTDQSERSISEISSAKFRKIECSKLRNTLSKFILFRKLTVHTRNFSFKSNKLT